MKKLSDFVTFGEDGKPIFDDAAYTAELDRARNEASATARTNAEKELRKSITDQVRNEIEENAKLSAEEKLAKDREALVNERKSFNSERFKSHLKNANLFSDEEVEVYMGLLSDNYDESIGRADKVIAARTKYNEDYDKKVKQELQVGLPRGNGGGQESGGTSTSYAAKKAQSYNTLSDNAEIEL